MGTAQQAGSASSRADTQPLKLGALQVETDADADADADVAEPTGADRVTALDVPFALDALPDGVVVIGPDRVVRQVSASAERVLGQPAAELVGRDVLECLPLQDTDGRGWWA